MNERDAGAASAAEGSRHGREPDICLARSALPGAPGAWDVTISGGRVAELRPRPGEPRRLVLPSFHEPHCHADRAYLKGARAPRSLEDAIATTLAVRDAENEEDIAARATRLLVRASSYGVTRVRSHVDVDPRIGLRAVRALTTVRRELAGVVDVEIAAFASLTADPAEGDVRTLLRQALLAGADLLGGVPTLYSDPRASVPALLDLAVAEDVAVDVHIDETVDAASSTIGLFVDAAVERDLVDRVTLSHCCALGSLPRDEAATIIGQLAALGAVVHVQPALNLYLQDRREAATPRLRGLAPVRELIDAGVPVRFGSDNVGDAFYPYGDADPLEAAFLGALAAHVDDELALLGAVTGGRTSVEVGDPADLVIVAATSLNEAFGRRPAGRSVLRAGAWVAGWEPDLVGVASEDTSHPDPTGPPIPGKSS